MLNSEYFKTVYHESSALFLNVPGTFVNATHQVKAIAIGIFKANPLAESVDCSFPVESVRIGNRIIITVLNRIFFILAYVIF